MSDQPEPGHSEQSEDVNPHKQLLLEAAAEIRADQIAREKERPQNVGEGTLRLVQNTLRGVVFGTASVVLGPVEGYKQSGPKGIVSGTLGGLAAGVATTAFGIGSGIMGFSQGAARTARKMNPPSKDPRFEVEGAKEPSGSSNMDNAASSLRAFDTSHSIKETYLEERKRLYNDLMAEFTAENATASMDGLTAPIDKGLYDILEVDVCATPDQIRKAYYRMAQRYHPDKHQGDMAATEMFQKIGNAYQYV